MRTLALVSAAVLGTTGIAFAQFSPSPNDFSQPAMAETSSSSSLAYDSNPGFDLASSGSGAAAGGQYGGHYRPHENRWSRLTFEAGGGFNAPSTDSSPYITWGGNLTVGAGYRFNSYLSLMTEYQFINDKLPGAIIAEAGSDGGNAHIWSFTMAPVLDLFPKSTNSVYVTGGGGFYRKVTNFTDLNLGYYCDYFYCYPGVTSQVVGHFSSNQGGWNGGIGFTHKLGSRFSDSKMKLFAEARFLRVLSPTVYTQPNGLGATYVDANTDLIPVTLGVRW
jgi:hypothetical protein